MVREHIGDVKSPADLSFSELSAIAKAAGERAAAQAVAAGVTITVAPSLKGLKHKSAKDSKVEVLPRPDRHIESDD